MINAIPRPLHPWERDPVPIVQDAGWASKLVWIGAENLALTMVLFIFFLILYFIRTWFFVFIVLHVAFFSLLTTHNTNTHALGGIQTRDPSKRSAVDPRLRSLGP
jgi:hypothetical protein